MSSETVNLPSYSREFRGAVVCICPSFAVYSSIQDTPKSHSLYNPYPIIHIPVLPRVPDASDFPSPHLELSLLLFPASSLLPSTPFCSSLLSFCSRLLMVCSWSASDLASLPSPVVNFRRVTSKGCFCKCSVSWVGA